jgi:hypothetical protein
MPQQKIIYETGRGYKLELQAVSPFELEEIKATVPEVLPPTYEAKIAGGGIQTHYHDADSLKTEEEHAAWDDYLARKRTADAERTKRVTLAMIEDGIANLPQPTEAWEAKRRKRGLEVPDDPDEKMLKFLESEILGSLQDFMALQTNIMRAGGDVAEETISQIESSFRDLVHGATVESTPNPTGALESQSIIGIGARREGLGDANHNVPEPALRGSGNNDSDHPVSRKNGGMGRGDRPARSTSKRA